MITMCITDDDVEEGAYVVLDEEEEDEENGEAAQENAAQTDGAVNGLSAQPNSADNDRYVAEAYSVAEEEFDRSFQAYNPMINYVQTCLMAAKQLS